mgnify:CR=1 FL=1
MFLCAIFSYIVNVDRRYIRYVFIWKVLLEMFFYVLLSRNFYWNNK